MSDSATLNSRLRVLIAKTFRAEKLYSSIVRQNLSGGNISSAKAGQAKLSEMANEIRAKEWQLTQSKLRTVLNDIIETHSSSQLTNEILSVTREFHNEAKSCETQLVETKAKLIEAGELEEFATSLKLSFELIRLKARLQACHSVISELGSLGCLEKLGVGGIESFTASSKQTKVRKFSGNKDGFAPKLKISGDIPLGEDLDSPPEQGSSEKTGSNVVPLKRGLYKRA